MAEQPSRNLAHDFEQEAPRGEGMRVPVVETPGTGGQQGGIYIPMMQLLHQMMGNARTNGGAQFDQQGEISASEQEGESTYLPSTTASQRPSHSRIIISSEGAAEESEARKLVELRNLKRKIRQLEDQLKIQGSSQEHSHRQTRSSWAEGSGSKKTDPNGKGRTEYQEKMSHEPYIPHRPSGAGGSRLKGSPFSRDILGDPLPSHFKPVNYEYDDTTDPEEYVSRFENMALLHQYSEGVKCRVFATTLVGLAQQWFKQLTPQSIFSFEDFYELFIGQFASAKRSARSSLHLTTIKQDTNESLREYVSKFNMVALETPGIDSRIKVHAFVQGLRGGPFFDALVLDEPKNFNDLLTRATPFIQLEEAKSARRAENEKARPPPSQKTPPKFGNRPQPTKWSRQDNQQPCGTNEATGPSEVRLTRPMSAIMEIAQKLPGWTAPLTADGPPKGRPSQTFCKFHNQYGHDTDNCYNLKMVIERLVREGKLAEFVQRGGNERISTQGTARNVANRTTQARMPPPPPPLVNKPRIEMIMGGEGTSNRAKKADARKARFLDDRVMELSEDDGRGFRACIEFNAKDERPMMQPHNDALVICADIADFLISRTFVDTGSSVNVLYYNCLKKMDLGERLQPPSGALYGFSGESVIPLGSLCLPVSLGSPSACVKRMVEFVVLDLPNTAYNAILGRPALNTFKAIVSTYHLKMKFPVKGGVGEIWGNQVSSKECYVKAISQSNKRKAVAPPPQNRPLRSMPDKEETGEPQRRQEGKLDIRGTAREELEEKKRELERKSEELKARAKELEGKIEESEGKTNTREGKANKLTIYELKEDGTEGIELEKEKPQMEPGEEVLTIELYTDKKGYTTKVGAGMAKDVETAIIDCLRRNADVFAFKPDDLKGIDPSIALHRLNEDPQAKPVKQKLRLFGAEKDEIIRKEVEKLLEAKHIVEVQFPLWLANAVLVSKAEGKWRMCIDFRDLNKACLKDHYPLPRIDQLVDSTSGCELLSMMDAYQGYHQVQMDPTDIRKVAFAVWMGVFGWARMPFGLKNAGATYQRMMDTIFKHQIGRNTTVYVDDILVRSRLAADHVKDLEEVLGVARANKLMLNPAKCTFGVTRGKFLGYMVTASGIEANQAKVEAFRSMTAPRNIKEVQKLNGRITALSRFISRTADRSLPFFKILRTQGRFEWTRECQAAFEQLKDHLIALPLLSKPLPGDDLILYLAISESALSTVLLKEEGEQQKPIYFVSKVFQGAETRYTELEKAALAVITTARKLRPYFMAHKVIVRTTFPFLQVLGRPDISGRMVKWAVELGEYDVDFQNRVAIKAQALVDFIAETTRPTEAEEWKAWVDGSVAKGRSGVGIIIEKPDGSHLQFAVQFECHLSNNEAEYEAMVRAMKMLTVMGAEKITINTDSQLVAQQISGAYEVKEERMKEYLEKINGLAKEFQSFEVKQIPREENEGADKLARLASSESPPSQGTITLLRAEGKCTINEIQITQEAPDWRSDIIHYLRTGEGKGTPSRLAAKYARYYLLGDQLYRRGFNDPHLRCLSKDEGRHILQEIHGGCCGNHSGKRDLTRRAIRAGYYWPGIMETAKEVAQKCDNCQRHAPLIHLPGEEMGAMYASCPFDKWGIDIVGKFPTAPGGKVFLIVAIDYFSKWVEAEAVTKIDDATVQKFLWKNICCRYGIPRILVSDNGTQFTSARMQEWCEDIGIKQRFVSVAHPQANGQVEVTNRTITDGIKKRLEKCKGKWAEELDAVLWAYRTSSKTATGEAPFTLVYGTDAVIPAEMVMETYRVRAYDEGKNSEIRREELDLVEIYREKAHVQEEKYKSQIRATYNKRVKIRRLQKGDLVLKRVDAIKPVAKLGANWEGPFIIKEVLKGGAYLLTDMEGRPLTRPWNINTIKKYYA